jgi:uncharacterized membrane protein
MRSLYNFPYRETRQKTSLISKESFIFFLGSLILSLFLISFFSPAKCLGKEESISSSAVISYSLNDFSDGKAKYFQYKSPKGKTIRFFIIKSSDGIIRAAFDACDVCWPSGKGYAQDGDFMVCRNCGRRFPSSKVNVITGGCNPAALNRQITKTQVVIKINDLLAGQHYFDF